MGLYAHVDLSDYIDYGEELLDMGNQIITGIYDEHLEDLDSGSGSDEAGVQWDDMEEVIFDGWASSTEKIVQSFKAAFMDTINELCPVRTGYLISSIHCDGSDTEIDCYAEAEYAQYVEYGTYKMAAQPYFEPAIRAGIEAARMTAEIENDRIRNDIEQEWLQVAEEACDSIGPSIAAVMLALMLIMILYAIIRAICDQIKHILDSVVNSALEEALNIMII